MRKRWQPGLVIVGCLMAASACVHALDRLPDDAVLLSADVDLSDLAVFDAKTSMAALPIEGAAPLINALTALSDPLAFEHAAAGVIDRLQSGPDSASARAALEALSRMPVRVFQRQEETAADWFVPVFDIPGRAQSALRLLAQRALTTQWRQAFERDPAAALLSVSEMDDEGRDAAQAAITSVSPVTAEALLRAAQSLGEVAPALVWYPLAQALPRGDAYIALAQHGSDAEVLNHLPTHSVLSRDEAVAWLFEVSKRPALRSAALLALAPYADVGSPVLQHLRVALDDAAAGPSAALALAQRPQADRIDVIVSMRDAVATPLGRRYLTLALRLEGSADALRILGEWSADSRLSEAVLGELSR